MEYKEVFEKFDIFEGLNDEERKTLASYFKIKTFEAEDVIYTEGEKGGTLNLLTKGRVRVSKMIKDKESLTYATVGQGELFGLMSFMDGSHHSASIIADKDTEVVMLEKSDFDSQYDRDPLMVAKMLRHIGIHLCEIVKSMNTQYKDLTAYMYRYI
jgi:CRP-like cAMP-binding protein